MNLFLNEIMRVIHSFSILIQKNFEYAFTYLQSKFEVDQLLQSLFASSPLPYSTTLRLIKHTYLTSTELPTDTATTHISYSGVLYHSGSSMNFTAPEP